ncbi:MAG: hypothetical protein KJO07_14135, partial [Deltaproteobacteria bacterium]|nr:hypothetical protein [Deltaproteobacteria bacterium]
MQRYRGQLRKETLRIVQRALERQTLLATSKTLAAALPMVAVIAALGPSNPLYYLALLPVMVAVGLWLRAIPRQELVALPFCRALLSGDVAWIRRADDNGLVPSATITIGTRSGQSHCIVIARCDARRAVELLCAMAPWTRVGPPPQPDGRRHQPRIGPRTCGKMVRLAPPPSAFAITLLLGIATGCVVGDGNDPQDSDTTEFAGVTRSVSSKSQFLAALRNAGSGDHIKLARTAVIDLTGESELVIPAGVTISGGRSSKYPGAVLRTREDKGLKYWNLLRTGGPGVTIRDLRLEGPDQTIGKGRSNYATGIRIHHQRTAVEGCAIYGWPGAGVGTKSLD